MRRRKPFGMNRSVVSFTPVTHAGSTLKIYADERLYLEGDVKMAAIGLSEFLLKELGEAKDFKINRCVKITRTEDKNVLIEWSSLKPPPLFWNSLKNECEKICKMKAFV